MANGMIAGIYNAWIAARDSNGYPVGSNPTPDTKVNGQVYAAYRVKYPVRYGGPQPTREQAIRRGGMATRGRRDLGISDYGTFQFEMDAFDDVFHALITRSLVDTTTMTGWRTSVSNSNEPTLPRFCMGMSIGFTDDVAGDQFMTAIYHNVQIRPVLPASSQEGGVNPNTLTYEVIPDVSPRAATGRLISAMATGARDASDIMMQVIHPYEIYLATFVGNGSLTNFTVPFRPIYSDATGVLNNSITKQGVTQAATTVAPATGIITFAAAPLAADIVVAAVPTAYVPSP